MRIPIYYVDAFTNHRFSGNPAAVMPMQNFLSDESMQAIAAENNLSETAFLVQENGNYRLRWFTPLVEVPLCGHATLASAAVVMQRLEPGRRQVVFQSLSGPLTVKTQGAGYMMDFPARPSEPIPVPLELTKALGAVPAEVLVNEFNYMAVLKDESTVRGLVPDFAQVARIGRPGVIVTAASHRGYDFVSRYFAPAKGIPEDPVTGAAHCMLAPYWAKRLGRNELHAFQASRRGGEIICRVKNDRVELQGSCVFYLQGEVEI
jgi:PhzF family phenazine biosynthesis protein